MSDMVPPQDWTPQEPERSPDFTSPQAASPAAATHPHPDAGWEVVDLPGTISLAELEQQALAAFEKLGFVASSPVSHHPQPDSDQTPEPQTPEAQIPAPETPKAQAPKARDPETQAPEIQAPKTQAPKAQPDQHLMQVMQAEINQNPLLQALQAQNQDLQRRVSQLEEVLNDCRDTLQLQMMRSQTQETLLTQQTDELTNARTQLRDLLGELATSQEAVEKQQILIETLTRQLEGSQERVAHLERVCALAQQRHVEQVNHIQQSEQTCRELRSRLHRQQRQTLQFRTALEQCLELPRHAYPPTGAHSPSHPQSLVGQPDLGLAPHPIPTSHAHNPGTSLDALNHDALDPAVSPLGLHQDDLGEAANHRRSAIQPWSAHPSTFQDTPASLLDPQDEAALEAPIMPKRDTPLPDDLRPSELAALAAWELEADQPTPEAIASRQEYNPPGNNAPESRTQDDGPEFDEDAMLPEQFAPSDWPGTIWTASAELAIADQSAIAPVATTPPHAHSQPHPEPQLDATILETTAAAPANVAPIHTNGTHTIHINGTKNDTGHHPDNDNESNQPHPSLAKVLEMGAALLRQSQDRRSSASVVALESLDERAHADAVAFAALDLSEAFGSDVTTAEISPPHPIMQGAITNTLNLPQFEQSAPPSPAKVIPLNPGQPPTGAATPANPRLTPPLLQAKSSTSQRRTTLAAVELPRFNRRSS